jgi:MFS family permease
VAVGLNRNVLVLAALQALLLANNATALTLHALAGGALAPQRSLATLPITGWVVGGAVSTFWASGLMRRLGRRAGFMVGAVFGLAGTGLCALAVYLGSFALFLVGATVLGVYNAFGAYHRFAAADAVSEGACRATPRARGRPRQRYQPRRAASRSTPARDAVPRRYLALVGFLVVVLVQRLLIFHRRR